MDVIINLAWLGFIIMIALFLAQFVLGAIMFVIMIPIVAVSALWNKFTGE